MATSALAWENFFETTLASDITSSATTIALNTAVAGNEGFLVIEPDSASSREIIYFTSKSGSSVILPSVAAGRGVGGTTAVAHSSGAAVEMNTVAEMFKALQDGTALGPGSVTTPAIADEGVTSRKLAPVVIQETSTGSATTTGSGVDIPGCTTTFTPDIASVAIVIGTFYSQMTVAEAGALSAILNIDGVGSSKTIMDTNDTTGVMRVAAVWVVALTAAAHTLKLQIDTSGSQDATVSEAEMTVFLLGDANATVS